MAIRKLRYYNDPILRKVCREVTNVNDRIQYILEDMLETLHATPNGAAIAAPQVGILKRLVVIDMGTGIYQLVNPKIIEQSGFQECVEGCLSVPDKFGKTIRPQKVTIQALNALGEPITITGEDELAKCFCHELDHLDGILFIDKVIEYLEE